MYNDKQQFYNNFLAEMGKSMAPADIKVSGENLNAGSGVPGISFHLNDTLIIPSVYPDILFIDYKHGTPIEGIVEAEKKMILEKVAEISAFDIHSSNPEDVAGRIRAAVVNLDSGQGWIKNIPHEKLLDLAVYAKLDFGAGYGLKVDNGLLTDLHMTREELFKIAKGNVLNDRELIKVEELALEYIYEHGAGEDEVQDMAALISLPSYIYDYRNKVELDGAAVISSPAALKKIHEQLNDDFYVLPCSAEQVLIVPKSEYENDLADLEKFIKEMREREIPLKDHLSTHVYEYDGSALKLAGSNLTHEKDGLMESVVHRRSR